MESKIKRNIWLIWLTWDSVKQLRESSKIVDRPNECTSSFWPNLVIPKTLRYICLGRNYGSVHSGDRVSVFWLKLFCWTNYWALSWVVMPESTQTNLVSFLELSADECIPSRIVKALVLTLTLPSFTDPLPRIMILAPLWEENKTLDVIKLSLLLHCCFSQLSFAAHLLTQIQSIIQLLQKGRLKKLSHC